MKEWLGWLFSHRRVACLLPVCILLCGAVFALYRIPAAVIGYAGLLCFVAVLGFAIPDFISFRRRHRTLTAILSAGEIPDTGLPGSDTLTEADYAALANMLQKKLLETQSGIDADASRREEYYTLWLHQIKTPIAAMRLILRDTDTAESRETEAQLFLIERYADMALAYVRMDSDSTDYLLREYRLEDIVRQAIRHYAPVFIRRKLTPELSPIDISVVTDEKWLCFVIEQILSNAVKYTPHGTVRVFAEGYTLIIRDTGIGISPEDLPRLGEKGFTGQNGRTDKHASGIGLYLCRRILHRLGHTLTITSVLGEGTEVRISLLPPGIYRE